MLMFSLGMFLGGAGMLLFSEALHWGRLSIACLDMESELRLLSESCDIRAKQLASVEACVSEAEELVDSHLASLRECDEAFTKASRRLDYAYEEAQSQRRQSAKDDEYRLLILVDLSSYVGVAEASLILCRDVKSISDYCEEHPKIMNRHNNHLSLTLDGVNHLNRTEMLMRQNATPCDDQLEMEV